MIKIENGTVVLIGRMVLLGTGASPACPVCTKMGISHKYMQKVLHKKRYYFLCTPDGCASTFPADWTPELVQGLAKERLRCLKFKGHA